MRRFLPLLLLPLAGCTPDAPRSTQIVVDTAEAPADRPVHVRITGLPPDAPVEVEARATDHQGAGWRGHATFTPGADGTIDLRRDAPAAGTYTGVDGMGLFAAMAPPDGALDEERFIPERFGFTITVSVRSGRRVLAERDLRRVIRAGGVTEQTLTVAQDEVAGTIFRPAPGTSAKTPVLLFTGSDGLVDHWTAALLASHGFPTLALDYFEGAGLPDTLSDVPLEYFVRAARLLDPAGVVAVGYSRGSEAALLLADRHPGVVRGAVLYAPNDAVAQGFPDGGHAWTQGGRPIPEGPIAVDGVAGPVLAVAGGDDELWPSLTQTERLAQRLPGLQRLTYPQAGHGVGTFPHLPSGTRSRHPVTGQVYDHGGTPQADAAARSDGWPKVLTFLESVP